MTIQLNVAGAILVALAAVIIYTDVRYRRIPNVAVLAALVVGLAANTVAAGAHGLASSLGGAALAFGLMFLLHVFGQMGAGDVKLFAAVGAVVGAPLVLPAFFVVMLTGCLLALLTMLRAGTARKTILGVLQFFASLLMGWERPRFDVPADRRQTIPYGVAITLGSLISLFVFRA